MHSSAAHAGVVYQKSENKKVSLAGLELGVMTCSHMSVRQQCSECAGSQILRQQQPQVHLPDTGLPLPWALAARHTERVTSWTKLACSCVAFQQGELALSCACPAQFYQGKNVKPKAEQPAQESSGGGFSLPSFPSPSLPSFSLPSLPGLPKPPSLPGLPTPAPPAAPSLSEDFDPKGLALPGMPAAGMPSLQKSSMHSCPADQLWPSDMLCCLARIWRAEAHHDQTSWHGALLDVGPAACSLLPGMRCTPG